MSSGACWKSKNTKKTSKFAYRSSRKRFQDRRYKRSLKKKVQYTFYGQQTAASISNQESIPYLHPGTSRMDTKEGGDPSAWFWENYNNAMDWQNRHFVAFWKSRCAALEAENTHLYSCLKKMENVAASGESGAAYCVAQQTEENVSSNEMPNIRGTSASSSQQCKDAAGQMEEEDDDGGDDGGNGDEEFVFEINDDLMAFFETSAKHKLELKKQRDAEQKIEDEEAERDSKENKMQFPKETMQQRRDEMACIYGPAASMILSMETAMQLSFDRFNDRHHPKPWPNIPLNL